jgi:formylglycine-generating enzyme required for sulfatase activity
MVGNVWQWCRDAYAPYGKQINRSTTTTALRGGPWKYNNRELFETTARYDLDSFEKSDNVGFRLVVPASILAQPDTGNPTPASLPKIFNSALRTSSGFSQLRIPPHDDHVTISVVNASGGIEKREASGRFNCQIIGDKKLFEVVTEYPSGQRARRTYFLTPSKSVTAIPRKWVDRSAINDIKKLPYLRRYIDALCSIPAGDRPSGNAASAFRIGATPVTVGLWHEYCTATGIKSGHLSREADAPITGVTWIDIMGSPSRSGFVQWCSELSGLDLTLPTITQLELACHGEDKARVPWVKEAYWASKIDKDDQFMWCSTNKSRSGPASVYRVNNIYKNKFGVTDLIGNVRQWTNELEGTGTLREVGFICGVSWQFKQKDLDPENGNFVPELRTNYRLGVDSGADDVGFRLVHEIDIATPNKVQSVGIQLVGLLDEPTITVNGSGYQSKEITLATTKPVKSFVIKVEHYGWDTFETTVDVPAGTIKQVDVKLTGSKRASLQIAGIPPDAQIFIGAKKLTGTTYTEFPVIMPKSVEVLVYASGFRPHRQLVDLVGGTTKKVEVTLQRLPARTLTQCPMLQSYLKSLGLIPSGEFQMGSSTGASDERPKHTVRLSAFRLGATPVTVAVWKEYCSAMGIPLPKSPKWGLLDGHPVVNVSWNDIMGEDGKGGFCAWASELAGFRVTLPTEAQWEYAARGGVSGREFPWGNSFDNAKLWCSLVTDQSKTVPVDRSSNIYRNKFGLTDMVGNVMQWCADSPRQYSSDAQTNPVGPPSKTRCLRGIPWYGDSRQGVRCASRGGLEPTDPNYGVGFRLAAE